MWPPRRKTRRWPARLTAQQTPHTSYKENSANVTVSKLTRWAGLSALVAGILFVVIQPLHPPDTLSSVTADAWAIAHYLTIAMAVLTLVGITGLYASSRRRWVRAGLARDSALP
jgi:hypothetical protein